MEWQLADIKDQLQALRMGENQTWNYEASLTRGNNHGRVGNNPIFDDNQKGGYV